LSVKFPDVQFVLPLHPNPAILSLATARLSREKNVHIIGPQGYKKFLFLLGYCHFVITDSGGIQEEAVTMGVQVLVIRDQSERPEGISEGGMTVVGTDREDIVRYGQIAMGKIWKPNGISVISHVYGDGTASGRISRVLKDYLLDE
jgi:UDP-N-acetylglucosamine 2-epimerase